MKHRIEHDLEHKKQFSAPKIYNANGDSTGDNLTKNFLLEKVFSIPIAEIHKQ